MIPGKILKFLDKSNVAIAGTRDANLVPRLHRAASWSTEPDGETFVFGVPENYLAYLAENLENNGRVSITVTEVVSHETYQFKGKFIETRTVTPDDISRFENHRKRFAKGLTELFPNVPDDIAAAYINRPAVVVRFQVSEVFLQTPGPGAGTRLFPPEEK